MAFQAPHREEALWRALRQEDSIPARHEIFGLYSHFAQRIARRHFLDRKSGDIELPDLCQLAYAGLLEGIDKFDPSYGAPFSAYAERRISGSILDGIIKMSEVREQISYRNRVRDDRLRSLATDANAEMDTESAIRALAEAAVGLALGFMLEGTNLYVVDGADRANVGAYDSVLWKETLKRVGAELSALPEREQFIVRQHYLNGVAFEQIATLMNLSKGRVSQLHRTALTLLRKRMQRDGNFKLER